jgi:hypothetical protein
MPLTIRSGRKAARREATARAVGLATRLTTMLETVALPGETPITTLHRVLIERHGIAVDILEAWLNTLKTDAETANLASIAEAIGTTVEHIQTLKTQQ